MGDRVNIISHFDILKPFFFKLSTIFLEKKKLTILNDVKPFSGIWTVLGHFEVHFQPLLAILKHIQPLFELFLTILAVLSHFTKFLDI